MKLLYRINESKLKESEDLQEEYNLFKTAVNDVK